MTPTLPPPLPRPSPPSPPTPQRTQHHQRTLPKTRSPYGLNVPLDGSTAALIRPYLLAYEQEHAEERRSATPLTLADLRIGLPETVSEAVA